jgi:pimeloyl-ACP methyl ester carboxylesterase
MPRQIAELDELDRIVDAARGRLEASVDSPELAREHLRHVRWSSDYGYYLQLVAGWTSLPWLALLPQPTLVMSGADDPLVPVANAKILARLIPNARHVSIDDGHLFLVTSARESARIIGEFLTQ